MTDDLPSLSALREAQAPPLAEVHRQVRRRKWRRRASAGLTVAAALLLAVGVAGQAGGVRDRGLGGAPQASLEALVEVGGEARAHVPGRPIARDERVVFVVRADRPVVAVLTERSGAGSTVVYPPFGAWRLPAGESYPGGSQPLSWRPDGPPGPLRYELLVCPEAADLAHPGPDCSTARLELVWAP